MRRFAVTWLVVFSLSLSIGAGTAEATGTISGGIYATTIEITQNTRLTGNVTCTMTDRPCIDFRASHIKLWLNGFTVTGVANPDDPTGAGCSPSPAGPPADGIRIFERTNDQVLGPGMVQKFRRHGLFIVGSADIATRIKVSRVTSHHNCFSGILSSVMSESVIEGNVAVRNSANSGGAPCGGNCLVNSHNNRIRKNTFAGNGSVAAGAPDLHRPGSNDFGVGLVFGSSGNLIEDNTMGGNINGVLLHASATGNVIRRNIIAGNPPSQVSRTFGASIGADVKDESTVPGSGARNTIENNWCITYIGPGPAPCPNFPGPGPSENE